MRLQCFSGRLFMHSNVAAAAPTRAANPGKPTGEVYVQGLRDPGYSDEQIAPLLKMMDGTMAKLGG